MQQSVVLALIILLIVGVNGLEKCIRIIENNWISIEDAKIDNISSGLYPICGSFDNQINQTGWSLLTIRGNTSTRFNDSIVAYLAGYLEGYFTSYLINDHFDNAWNTFCIDDPKFCKKMFQFYHENLVKTKSKIHKFGNFDPYWYQISLILDQMNGLSDGMIGKPIYKSGINIDVQSKIFILNTLTDTMELESVYNRKINKRDEGRTTCSALIKLTPSDLLIGHATWYEFGCMLRVLKKYHLPYRFGFSNSSVVPGQVISMSSYPGTIFSADDYYLLSTGLVVMETTITNYNRSSYSLVSKNNGVLTFIRTMVSNRLARDGKSWCKIFAKSNSGTYNNQFMIIDYNRFNHGNQTESGLLWILEQMPGLIVAKDMTSHLIEQKYWSSYNFPYFPEIYEIGDYKNFSALLSFSKESENYRYSINSRGRQFKRKQSEVFDYKSALHLLRYNNYLKDPDARCNECNPPYSASLSIASRADLNDPKGNYSFANGFANEAAIDAKVTSFKLFQQFKMYAISGPTYEDVPPFIWSNSTLKDTVSHKGHPDIWVFEPIYF